MRSSLKAVALILALGLSTVAFAQEPPDPFSTARMRVGPLAITPTVALTNIGIETNVFNVADAPEKDFTATLTPQVQAWVRMGRSRLSLKSRLDVVHFQRHASERSANTEHDFRFEVPLARFKLFVSDAFLNTRQRPGYEIDTRARYLDNTFTIGGEVRISAKTDLQMTAFRTNVDFEADAVFQESSLREVLNRHEDGVRASIGYHVTPLTTFLAVAEVKTYRFDLSPIRNAKSVRMTPGVQFAPFALVNGSAYVGVRKYDAQGVDVPDYLGPVATVDLSYVLRGGTRFRARIDRDIAYSFEKTQPYYLQTGVTGIVTHRLNSTWDLTGTLGRQRLDYQSAGIAARPSERADLVSTAGGGIGYRLGPDLRLGLNIDQTRRESPLPGRSYDGLRMGLSVTYGQ